MIPQLNLSAGSSLNSDAPGYGQMSQSLEWYDCDQTRRTENETCCWFSKLLPAGNKMVDLQGVSAMWVNRLKEQREHRICKSLLSYFWCKSPLQIQFGHFCLCCWAYITMKNVSNWISVKLTVAVSECRSVNLVWEDAAIWDMVSMLYTSECALALHLHNALFLLLLWRKLLQNLEPFICFYGDSAFLTFSHFFSLLCLK